jgi:molybdenum cofactor cytidylyltransferase
VSTQWQVHDISEVGAVVLAAGRSRRMGEPKLVPPWGRQTVIAHVVSQLVEAEIREIVVVTGGARGLVEEALATYPVRLVNNPDFEHTEMLASLSIGIRNLSPGIQAMLVVLGDQPTIRSQVVKQTAMAYLETGAGLIIPSFQMRRGHPWLVGRQFWGDLLSLSAEQTMRDFLMIHNQDISYIQVDTPGILTDLDTPEDYQKLKPPDET